ncbi:MAG TPA: endonuclease III domain-containing protein [Methylomirabilota bacterium]
MRPTITSGRPVLAAWRRIPGPPRDPAKARLLRLYLALLRRFGAQQWWPGRSAYEIAVGAVLTQFTAWTNAARAIAALRARGLLMPAALAKVPETELATVIRAAGTYRVKARRVRALTHWLLERGGGRLAPLRRVPLAELRRDLLAVSGLGPETVDSILLYAVGRPVFVVDAYLRRVLARHRILAHDAPYERARSFMEAHLPSDPALLNEYHALIVAVGKAYCRTVPLCGECPLRFDLRGRAPAPLTRHAPPPG